MGDVVVALIMEVVVGELNISFLCPLESSVLLLLYTYLFERELVRTHRSSLLKLLRKAVVGKSNSDEICTRPMIQ
jgi:hypothetical protein